MKLGIILLAASTLALSTGCATILKGKYESIAIASEPPGARVTVNGMAFGKTPTLARVDGTRDQMVMITKEGHEPATILITSRTGTGWVILDLVLVPMVLPIIVDAVTGNWKSLDQNNVSVVLDKK